MGGLPPRWRAREKSMAHSPSGHPGRKETASGPKRIENEGKCGRRRIVDNPVSTAILILCFVRYTPLVSSSVKAAIPGTV